MTTPARTLVFVPLPEEMSHIDSLITQRGFTHVQGGFDERDSDHTYSYARPNRKKGLVTFQVLGDAGNVRAASIVAAACHSLQPEVLLMAGLAGSLNPELARLGDVFVIDMAKLLYADKIKQIDPKREVLSSSVSIPRHALAEDGRFMLDVRKSIMGSDNVLRYRRDVARSPRGSMMLAEYINGLDERPPLELEAVTGDLLDGLTEEEMARCINEQPKVKNGVVLGSEMVVDSQPFIDFLHERNKHEDIGWYALRGGPEAKNRNRWRKGDIPIVDMESYGFFKYVETLTASGYAMRAFAIRGVSDLAAGKAALDGASKEQIRKIAVRNAAVVTLDLLRALDGAEISGIT